MRPDGWQAEPGRVYTLEEVAERNAAARKGLRAGRYVKRPLQADAVRFERVRGGGAEFPDQPGWVSRAFGDGRIYYQGGRFPYCTVRTRKREEVLHAGNWLLRGEDGELRICDDETFRLTYEPLA